VACKLPPINDIIAKIRAEAKATADGAAQRAIEAAKDAIAYGEEKVAKVERNRQAFADLDAAGFTLPESLEWRSGAWADIELGFFPSTKTGNRELREKIKAVRQALDCSLGTPGKSLRDGKKRLIAFVYSPEAYPGLTIEFERKLPRPRKGATAPAGKIRCRIVTTRRIDRQLVCERVEA
jgi:hypothetical protein